MNITLNSFTFHANILHPNIIRDIATDLPTTGALNQKTTCSTDSLSTNDLCETNVWSPRMDFVKFLNQLHGISEHDVRRTGLIPGGQNVVIAVLNHRRQLMRWLQLRAPVRVRKPNNKGRV